MHELINSFKLNNQKNYIDSDFELVVSSLNEKGYFPQIYIPNLNNVKSRLLKSKRDIYIIDALNTPDSIEFYESIYVDSIGDIKNSDFLIDKNFASENEVWVVSLNERVNITGEINEITNSPSNTNFRIGTKSEYMLKINCPQLDKIESWVKGAPELRLILKSAKGEISEQFFYPSKRKQINNKWWDIDGTTGRYLYYWDIETYTKTVLFAWVEVDGVGDQLEISGSFIYKDVNSNGHEYTGTANYKYTMKSWDKSCGSISVHFDDGMVGVEYNTGLVKYIDAYK